MKMFVNVVARLEIGQLVSQGTRQKHPCTLDTFLINMKLLKKKSITQFEITPGSVWFGTNISIATDINEGLQEHFCYFFSM